MEVRVIILLEFSWGEAFSVDLGLKDLKLLQKRSDEFLVLWSGGLWLWLLVVLLLLWKFHLDFLWNIWFSIGFGSLPSNLGNISITWNIESGGDQIGVGHNELHMLFIGWVKFDVAWGSLWS
jgi:hypothetical protein